eukprot:3935407-Rhodomonas_salina.7
MESPGPHQEHVRADEEDEEKWSADRPLHPVAVWRELAHVPLQTAALDALRLARSEQRRACQWFAAQIQRFKLRCQRLETAALHSLNPSRGRLRV